MDSRTFASSGEVSRRVSKQEAAQRLILCGIRLLNEDGDPFGVHVIAASALNMLREIVGKKGPGYAERAFQSIFYQAALQEAEGRTADIPFRGELNPVIETIAGGIRSGSVEAPSDIKIVMPDGEERELLDHVISPFNFLKHGSRDPEAFIVEEDIQPADALIHAVAAYSMLFPDDVLPAEVLAFLESHGLS